MPETKQYRVKVRYLKNEARGPRASVGEPTVRDVEYVVPSDRQGPLVFRDGKVINTAADFGHKVISVVEVVPEVPPVAKKKAAKKKAAKAVAK